MYLKSSTTSVPRPAGGAGSATEVRTVSSKKTNPTVIDFIFLVTGSHCYADRAVGRR
jgi:hypothetical protein